jgi:hypothetical protein
MSAARRGRPAGEYELRTTTRICPPTPGAAIASALAWGCRRGTLAEGRRARWWAPCHQPSVRRTHNAQASWPWSRVALCLLPRVCVRAAPPRTRLARLATGQQATLRIIHARGRLCMQEDWRFLLHGGAAAADRSIQDRSIPPVMSDGSSRGVAGFLTPSYPRLRAERGPPWTSRSGESQPHGSCSRLAACSSSFGSLRRLALPVAGPPSRSKSTRTPIIWDRRRASGTSSRLPAGAWLAPRCLPAAAAPPAAVRKLWGSCAVVLPDLLRRFASSSVQGWTKVRHPPPARLPIAATDGRRVEANL